ncbi:hypothetical protein [Serratia liquefaciens]|uniref:hypothetical protein n=1 Tax=Serratia liquefaciens TaxID=614 RepID=UPI0021578000|nr:hypothetical protein [Serratia liquefaciens]
MNVDVFYSKFLTNNNGVNNLCAKTKASRFLSTYKKVQNTPVLFCKQCSTSGRLASNFDKNKKINLSLSKNIHCVTFLQKNVFPNRISNRISNPKISPVAVYGFEEPQMGVNKFVKKCNSIVITKTVAELNEVLGIVRYLYPEKYAISDYYTGGIARSINELAGMVKRARPPETIAKSNRDVFSHKLLNKWCLYLKENKNKTDVFYYISKFRTLPHAKKEHLLKKLIVKNTSSFVEQGRVFEFIEKSGLFLCNNLTEASVIIEKEMCSGKGIANNVIYGVFELMQSHFFRNTSKLGLDFFRENKFHIMMAWNNHDGIGKISLPVVKNKFFDSLSRRNINGHEMIEPITFSEIRHVIKHEQDFEGKITRVSMHGDRIELSEGISSRRWVVHDRSAFF